MSDYWIIPALALALLALFGALYLLAPAAGAV